MILRLRKLQKLMFESGGGGIVKYSADNNNITYLDENELNLIDNTLLYSFGSRLVFDAEFKTYIVADDIQLTDIDLEYISEAVSNCLITNQYQISGLLNTMDYDYNALDSNTITETETRTPDLTETTDFGKSINVKNNHIGDKRTTHGQQKTSSNENDYVTTYDSDEEKLASKTNTDINSEQFIDTVSSDDDVLTETQNPVKNIKKNQGNETIQRTRKESFDPQKLIENQRNIIRFNAYYEIAKIIAHDLTSGFFSSEY